MIDNRILATSSPNNLLFNASYWLSHQRIFLGLLSISIIVFILLFNLNFPKSDDPIIIISVAIYGFALWGIWMVIEGLIKISIEKAIADRIAKTLAIELSKIRSRENDRIDLERISDLLPSTSSNFQSAIIRLTEHIIEEARDRKFESSDIIMRPYKEEAIGDIFKVSTIQKIALRLGILGTFIGLIIAFVNLKDLDNLDANFYLITNALQYSFSTSVAGLEASIMLALFIVLLNRKQDIYFKLMEDAAQTTLALARNSINKDTFLVGFDQMKESMKEVKDGVYAQQVETKAQTRAIQDGILKLKDAQNTFDEFLFNITNEIKDLYKTISPKNISEDIKINLENSVKSLSDVLEGNITNQLAKYNQISTSMSTVSKVLQQIERQLSGQIALNDKNLTKAQKDIYDSVSELSALQQKYLIQIMEYHPSQQTEQVIKKVEANIYLHLEEQIKSTVNITKTLEKAIDKYSNITQGPPPPHKQTEVCNQYL